MHRIDDPTAATTLPAPRAQGVPGYFTGGSPGSGGFAATIVRYEFMNALQEELAAIVTAAGLTLDKTNNNQVLAALRSMLRFKLTQDEYFYISPSGNDTNDGLTPSTPLKSGQAAWNQALLVDLNGHNLYLQFANGTYTDSITLAGRPLGLGAGNGIVLQGNNASPDQVVFAPAGNASCITAQEEAIAFVTGVTLRSTGIPGSYQNEGTGLVANVGGTLIFGSVDFDTCDYAHTVAISGGMIQSGGNPYRIVGGGQHHMIAVLGGYNANVNSPVTITGNPAFSLAFAMAESNGIIAAYGAAFAGAATGKRYQVDTGGLINTGSAGANFFPGSIAGTADAATFGLYT